MDRVTEIRIDGLESRLASVEALLGVEAESAVEVDRLVLRLINLAQRPERLTAEDLASALHISEERAAALLRAAAAVCANVAEGGREASDDELVNEAKEVVRKAGKASSTLLQTRLSIGYARAARIIDCLEQEGYIGQANGSKPREVYG